MPRVVTDSELQEVVRVHHKNGGLLHKTVAELQQPRTTVQHWLKLAEQRGIGMESVDVNLEEVTFPDLPSSELSVRELIAQAKERFLAAETARVARRWMEIKVNSRKPIGLTFVGDPHIDSPGCNWPLLERDINLLERTAGMYAVNIGDLTDNWLGRLMRLYADSSMSKKQAWKTAAFLLRESEIKWLCHILGNHDSWGDGAYLIKANARPLVPVEDWQSRFQLVFPTGCRIRIHAAHDFPGHSMWNKMHGPQKAAMLGEEAHIYACGHKHQWECVHGENAQRNFTYHLIRARGYKFIDSHADQLGYPSQQFGASITAIIDPNTKSDVNRVVCFADLEEAADYLNYKRSRE